MVMQERQGAASHTRLSAGSLYIISLRKRGMAGAAGGRRGACGLALSLNIPGGRKRGLLAQVLFRRLKSRTTAMVSWPEPVP